jgi:ABC-type arginine/histidine transport system permease subunit
MPRAFVLTLHQLHGVAQELRSQAIRTSRRFLSLSVVYLFNVSSAKRREE